MIGTETPKEEDAKPIDVEAILNRARVNLARSQRLVDGWIPLAKNQVADERTGDSHGELAETLILRPERAGLGVDFSRVSTVKSSTGQGSFLSNTELEKLRMQLLGRKAGTGSKGAGPSAVGSNAISGGHARPQERAQSATKRPGPNPESDSEEEQGRAALFKSKRKKTAAAVPDREPQQHIEEAILQSDPAQAEGVVEKPLEKGEGDDIGKKSVNEMFETEDKETTTQTKSKPSYLDQVLAERSKKKRRKKKKTTTTEVQEIQK